MSIARRVIAVAVAAVYLVAAVIMIERADYSWATVQFALASLSILTVI